MSQWRKGPATLYFEAKKYFFWLRWTETALQIEAVNKGELTKCFKGEMRSEEKTLRELYQFLEIHSYRESLSDNNADEISLIMTIIDLTEEGKGHACRLIFNDSIREVRVEPTAVSEAYFLSKKIEAIEYEKKNDRMIMAEFGSELTRKLEEKDEDIKKTLAEQMQCMISALASQIERKLDSRKKEDEEDTGEGLDMKKIERKLRKKIKKELKERKREKRREKKEKRKRRKERKRQKKRLQAILEGQLANGQPLQNDINIEEGIPAGPQNPALDNLQNFPFHDQDPNNFLNVDAEEANGAAVSSPEQKKKKKKKEKHRHERPDNQPLVVQPQVTSLNSMAKLRNRGGDLTIPVRAAEPIEIPDERREKKSKHKKEKKEKREKREKREKEVVEVEEVGQTEEAGEKEYYKRLEQLRRAGDIDKVRMARASRIKPVLAAPKQALSQVDEFNPKYNGEPKYKPFVGLNEYQTVRPGEIFVPRAVQASSECRRIPAVFREDTPCVKYYEVNGNVVRKTSGSKYHQLLVDYCVPQRGRHVLTMRLIQSKRSYLWFGVVDLREKDREESFNQKNCITFSFRTGHAATGNKWSKAHMGRVEPGLAVRMEIDMDKNCVVWFVSDGKNCIAPIPKLMRKLNLAPYFEMMDAGDEVCFEE